MSRSWFLPCFLVLACLPLEAQEARVGIAVPFTVTGEALATQRLKALDPGASNRAAAFRATAYPLLKLGESWYLYSAVQLSSEPFFFYQSYYDDREVKADLLQVFLGYTRTAPGKGFSFKVGKLSSAFGAFPLRYDDAANWVLDQPQAFASYLKLRPDQLPCGVNDLLHQQVYLEGVHHYCGGATDEHYGIVPVSLYGLPGAEVDFSLRNFDARFQITNSSPANPQSLLSENQTVQWTVGAGYTIFQGFRVGVSAFRGPFLEQSVRSLLPGGQSFRDYPATAVGADLQGARGRWSVNAEWQRSRFSYPAFRTPPQVDFFYAEVKSVITPRIYGAFRAGSQWHNRVEDRRGKSNVPFQPNRQSYEFALGYRLNRFQLLKFGYQWVHQSGASGTRDNVLGLQFVTSIPALSKAIY